MQELYLGLVPGEAPVDGLVDGVIADPAFIAARADADLVVDDPVTGAILGVVPADHRNLDPGDGGLWRRLRTRWTSAHGAPHV